MLLTALAFDLEESEELSGTQNIEIIYGKKYPASNHR